jgi:hypothetical protein
MSTIKSSAEDLTLNADGSGNDIIFQSNASQVGSLTAEGVLTATSFAGSGSSLTGVGVDGISSSANATAITIDSSENVGIGVTPESGWDSKFTVLEIAPKGIITSSDAATDDVSYGYNWYENGGTAKYKESDYASIIEMRAGKQNFKVAPSGSADASITWTNAMTIDNSGNVGIGNTTPEAWGSAYSVLQLGGAAAVWGHSGTAGYLSQNVYNDTGYKYLTTSGASLILMNGGEFKFRTAASGSADAAITWTEALDLGTEGDVTVPTGDLIFGTAGKGICLGVTSNTDANTLDDYEEGTWTASLVGTTTGSLGNATGVYTKIGNVVYVGWYSESAVMSSSTGAASIAGLPFTVGTPKTSFTFHYVHGNAVDGDSTGGNMWTGGTSMYFYDHNSTAQSTFINGTKYIMVSGWYMVA